MEILRLQGIKKTYGAGDGLMYALNGVTLAIEQGEFVAIVGASGSGKSTLLHMLGGLDRPTEGEVFIEENNLTLMKDDDLTIFRRRNIGFIFQNYNLIPTLNVYDNIVLPIKLDSKPVDKEYINRVVETLELGNKLKNLSNNLSGGQQQRVAIARALAMKPKIILADEPTGNLDSKTSQQVMDLLKRMNKEFNQTMVMITHNKEIAQMADRIIQIADGVIIEDTKNEANMQ